MTAWERLKARVSKAAKKCGLDEIVVLDGLVRFQLKDVTLGCIDLGGLRLWFDLSYIRDTKTGRRFFRLAFPNDAERWLRSGEACVMFKEWYVEEGAWVLEDEAGERDAAVD